MNQNSPLPSDPLATRWWPLTCYAAWSGIVMCAGWYMYFVKDNFVAMVMLTIVAVLAAFVALVEKDPERMRLWRMAQVIRRRHSAGE